MDTQAVQELKEVFSEVWAVAFKKPIVEVPPRENHDECRVYETEISISGAWHGRIVFFTSVGVAEFIARHMFMIDESEQPSIEQIEDSLKEFTNVIGGNLKTVLPEPSKLSIPYFSGEGKMRPVPAGEKEEVLASLNFSAVGDHINAQLLHKAE